MPGTLRAVLAAAVIAMLPAAGAHAQLVNGGFADPIGDVLKGASGQPVVPDIAGGTMGFGEFAPGTEADDLFSIGMYSVAVFPPPPGPGLGPGQILSFWVDADGSAATGLVDGPAGWDWLFEAEGVAAAYPAAADAYRWNAATAEWEYRWSIPFTGSRPEGSIIESWGLHMPAEDIGLVRGRTVYGAIAAWDPALDQDVPGNRDDTDIIPLAVSPPPAPQIAGVSAVADAGGGATVSATVDARGTDAVWWLRYGIGAPSSTTVEQPAGHEAVPVPVSATLTGLRPGTTYAYQVVARNRFGETPGPLLTFRTPDAPLASVGVATGPAASVSRTSAVLSGSVDPQGRALAWWFEWRPGASQVRATPRQEIPAGEFGPRPVSATITGLPPGTALRARLVVEAGGQRRDGAETTFSTSPGLTLSVTARGRCTATGCTVHTLRSRVAGPVRGLRITVRCLRRCALARGSAVPVTGRTADLRTAVGPRLPAGAVLRVTARVRGLPPAVAEIRSTPAGLRVATP
ncbi:MAG: fibronectin type III domain-containing protein [Thermoleophilia bacterium]